ncbi:MAG: phosphoribosylformylglycinamidine synthase I [Ilumatobacteraceae bacterium]|nr:phosphoribosylformylglycinamidine synthase I [Ilumatobacteraceae bacterium]
MAGNIVTLPVAAVLCAPGTNRDNDVLFALQLAGASPVAILTNELLQNPSRINDADILVIAGGFSYADALGAGRLFAVELEHAVGEQISTAISERRPIIGICNGFQTLVRMGILPGTGQRAALGHNTSGVFDCRWVELEPSSKKCVWTQNLTNNIECPIAHGEGRFTCDDDTLSNLQRNDQVALRYISTNPNGSVDNIAGVCDSTGVVLGLMPHPENHVVRRQHPQSHRGVSRGLGLSIFQSGVCYARR